MSGTFDEGMNEAACGAVDEDQMKYHRKKVRALKKSPETILSEMTPQKMDLLHMLLGKLTELGELATQIKSHVINNKPLDLENVIEELGDDEFYTEGFRQTLEILPTEPIYHNNQKLAIRFSDGKYSDEAAIARADKPEGQ